MANPREPQRWSGVKNRYANSSPLLPGADQRFWQHGRALPSKPCRELREPFGEWAQRSTPQMIRTIRVQHGVRISYTSISRGLSLGVVRLTGRYLQYSRIDSLAPYPCDSREKPKLHKRQRVAVNDTIKLSPCVRFSAFFPLHSVHSTPY